MEILWLLLQLACIQGFGFSTECGKDLQKTIAIGNYTPSPNPARAGEPLTNWQCGTPSWLILYIRSRSCLLMWAWLELQRTKRTTGGGEAGGGWMVSSEQNIHLVTMLTDKILCTIRIFFRWEWFVRINFLPSSRLYYKFESKSKSRLQTI